MAPRALPWPLQPAGETVPEAVCSQPGYMRVFCVVKDRQSCAPRPGCVGPHHDILSAQSTIRPPQAPITAAIRSMTTESFQKAALTQHRPVDISMISLCLLLSCGLAPDGEAVKSRSNCCVSSPAYISGRTAAIFESPRLGTGQSDGPRSRSAWAKPFERFVVWLE